MKIKLIIKPKFYIYIDSESIMKFINGYDALYSELHLRNRHTLAYDIKENCNQFSQDLYKSLLTKKPTIIKYDKFIYIIDLIDQSIDSLSNNKILSYVPSFKLETYINYIEKNVCNPLKYSSIIFKYSLYLQKNFTKILINLDNKGMIIK